VSNLDSLSYSKSSAIVSHNNTAFNPSESSNVNMQTLINRLSKLCVVPQQQKFIFFNTGRTDIASFPARLHVPAQRTAELCAPSAASDGGHSPYQQQSLRPRSAEQQVRRHPALDDVDESSETDRLASRKSLTSQRRLQLPHQQQQPSRSLGDLSDRHQSAEDKAAAIAPSSSLECGRQSVVRPQGQSSRTTGDVLLSTVTSLSEPDDCVIENYDEDSSDPGSGCGDSVVDAAASCSLISAGLALNRRVFVVGDRIVADVAVCNRSDVPAACAILFQQVS
jgi:hypothetical protein